MSQPPEPEDAVLQKSKTTDDRGEEQSASQLQWVTVGEGGKVGSEIKTVRSHVSKEHRRRKRRERVAGIVGLRRMRGMELRPGSARSGGRGDSKSAEGSPDSAAGLESAGRGKEEDEICAVEEGVVMTRRSTRRSVSPLLGIYDRTTNLIPYAWFEKDGPVLYVNRLKWPFPTPLHVTGSDRSDLSFKNLTPRQSGWTPTAKRASDIGVKGAVLDPNVLLWIGQSPECFQFRVECIRWIQDRLEDPTTAISDNTIAAIMTFAMWTAGYGNPAEMTNHMDAVERIVNLRGGFQSFHEDGTMAAKLTLFDSMIAVQTGQRPRFPPVNYFISQPITHTLETSMYCYESPLFGKCTFASTITYADNQETIITLLSKLWKLTQKFDIQNRFTCRWLPTHTIPFTTHPQNYYTTPLLTLPLLSPSTTSTQNNVLTTLLSAGVIYSRSLTYPDTDFPSAHNEKPFQELYLAFGQCSDDDFWVRYPGILLWVLLVGTAASRGKKEAAFWMFYLSRTGSFGTPETWLMGSAAIRRFLELQKWMREGRLG